MEVLNIFTFISASGKVPFDEWLGSLDLKTKIIIRSRIDRVSLGNLGDCKLIKNGDGISELRIDYGPGYRVYFARHRSSIIILLTGGDKSTQRKDIAKAKKYWTEYRELL